MCYFSIQDDYRLACQLVRVIVTKKELTMMVVLHPTLQLNTMKTWPRPLLVDRLALRDQLHEQLQR